MEIELNVIIIILVFVLELFERLYFVVFCMVVDKFDEFVKLKFFCILDSIVVVVFFFDFDLDN